jgi:hypothetical protein
MGVGGASPTAGTSCATCLRKFTVHFRVSDSNDNRIVNGKYVNSDYDGSFGFDWLRDEYLYPIISVDDKNLKPIFKGNPLKLISSYKDGQKSQMNPFGEQYIPSWLSMFSSTSSNQINKNGVILNIEIQQCISDDNFPLDNDGTKLFFLPSNEALKVIPDILDLNKFLQKKRKSKKIINRLRYFYEEKNIIKIICNNTINDHEEINVYAIKGVAKEKVGKLMVYRNNNIPKLELSFINVITNNQPIIKPDKYEFYLKYQSFNQALIRAERRLETNFDLVSLAKRIPEVSLFLNKVNSNSDLDADKVSGELIALFDRYGGKYRPNDGKKNLTINGDGHERTYIFYTNIKAGRTNGIAPDDKLWNIIPNGWGNSVVVFHQAQANLDTLVHEIGHSLKLPHIFEFWGNDYQFYQGQTSNIMDYTWYQTAQWDSVKKKWIISGNKKKRKFFSKIQWDILRSDRSLK